MSSKDSWMQRMNNEEFLDGGAKPAHQQLRGALIQEAAESHDEVINATEATWSQGMDKLKDRLQLDYMQDTQILKVGRERLEQELQQSLEDIDASIERELNNRENYDKAYQNVSEMSEDEASKFLKKAAQDRADYKSFLTNLNQTKAEEIREHFQVKLDELNSLYDHSETFDDYLHKQALEDNSDAQKVIDYEANGQHIPVITSPEFDSSSHSVEQLFPGTREFEGNYFEKFVQHKTQQTDPVEDAFEVRLKEYSQEQLMRGKPDTTIYPGVHHNQEGKAVFIDTGKSVEMVMTDNKSVAAGLIYAQEKFKPIAENESRVKLKVSGNEQFKSRADDLSVVLNMQKDLTVLERDDGLTTKTQQLDQEASHLSDQEKQRLNSLARLPSSDALSQKRELDVGLDLA
ncbi:LPD7 domain-containing protein [uncultured Methylophaga sp.]|uniref:LPD7 domain-containing protein n=1 Tax=uncultured Methylophaga sp. TaxID=285271 RepID=UPI0026334703|nr:LPD7 domain-containing protein [uncultured Methylophaga sp.]